MEMDFVKNIKDILNDFKLNPHFLIIEITESILIKDSQEIINKIKKIRGLGIQIAIDDFGTGYSSLQYLSSFNIDILKIDGSFIKNAIDDKVSDIITRTIVNLAKQLNFKLVAEGIETSEQLEYLRNLNCYAGQGYLYCKAVPEK
jgi:EAL domain-containing protein (putative c-di-GMP-specific phosphodiesterase class I)